MKEIYLAGGCFWGTEKYLELIKGVDSTLVGYANGISKYTKPTYEEVCEGNTGFAETVYVKYDPEVITLDFLLELFYDTIDPTAVNHQGGDFGTQYRTGIYFTDEADLLIIKGSIKTLQERYKKPIAIEVNPLENFYPAEEYHQKYLTKNPGGYCHIPRYKFELAAKANINQ